MTSPLIAEQDGSIPAPSSTDHSFTIDDQPAGDGVGVQGENKRWYSSWACLFKLISFQNDIHRGQTSISVSPLLPNKAHEYSDGLSEEEVNSNDDLSSRSLELAPKDQPKEEDSLSISVPIRPLAGTVLFLLLFSHLLLFGQCHTVYSATKKESFVVGRYEVVAPTTSSIHINNTKAASSATNGNVNILGKASSKLAEHDIQDILEPGDICETLEHDMILHDGEEYYRTIYPTAGFVPKKAIGSHLQMIEKYDTIDTSQSVGSSWCPLIYEGWWPQDHEAKKFVYAPTALVVAQCLWNAMQVLQLYLLLALVNNCHNSSSRTKSCGCHGQIQVYPMQNYLVCSLALVSFILLPFSVYVISLGGHIFAAISSLTAFGALMQPLTLVVSVSENGVAKKNTSAICDQSSDTESEEGSDNALSSHQDSSIFGKNVLEFEWEREEDQCVSYNNESLTASTSSSTGATTTTAAAGIHSTNQMNIITSSSNPKPRRVVREETIAFVANLFSTMYNERVPFDTMYAISDSFFGLNHKGDDSTPKGMYTFGLSNVRIPLFVSQTHHGSTFSHAFLLIWSLMPFVYVSYFAIMYMVAPKSPGVKVQRALCIFGIINFLFITDGVAYFYGRGYRSPHEKMFHWWEHFTWRFAILLPIYQNCTNGHWQHPKYPVAGNLFRIAVACYGIFFLVFQCLLGDIFQFSNYLIGGKSRTLMQMMGWDQNYIVKVLQLDHARDLATLLMMLMYGFLHFSGFPPFWVYFHEDDKVGESLPKTSNPVKRSQSQDENWSREGEGTGKEDERLVVFV